MAWRIQQWGDPYGKGWMEWPAGQIDRITAALNVYQAQAAYQQAAGRGDSAGWAASNAAAWDIVAKIIELRQKRKSERKAKHNP